MNGEAGNDFLYGEAGADVLNGGGGTDDVTLDYQSSTASVTVNYTATNKSASDGKTFTSIERFYIDGSESSDIFDISSATV